MAYAIIGFLWGSFALYKQFKIFPESQWWKKVLCFCLNAMGWPIGMMIAYANRKNNKCKPGGGGCGKCDVC